MRVMCINASKIEGHGNLDLHLLKEGRIYDVFDIHPETGGLNIGVRPTYCTLNDIPCYWGTERFIECQDVPDIIGDFEVKGNIKRLTDGNKRSDSEETEGSDSNKPI